MDTVTEAVLSHVVVCCQEVFELYVVREREREAERKKGGLPLLGVNLYPRYLRDLQLTSLLSSEVLHVI